MECIGFDLRPWMTSRSHPTLFARELHLNTMVVEQCHITAVAGLPFVPDVLFADFEAVYSTRGIPFDVLFHSVATEDDARRCVVAVLRTMSLMHAAGYTHLDAKLTNIVMLPGNRIDGVNLTLSSCREMHVAFIDFETLFVPVEKQREEDIARFDVVSSGMAVYGWKPHSTYAADLHRYRYDVHTFMVTLGRACVRDVHQRVLSAVARALGHIPTGYVSRSGSDAGREYDEYLMDSSMPVVSAEDAVVIVSAVCMPIALRCVRWSTLPCDCTADSYCDMCMGVTDAAMNTTCPYAFPDTVGSKDATVVATLTQGLRCCDGDVSLLRDALVCGGARPGDARRLAGLLRD